MNRDFTEHLDQFTTVGDALLVRAPAKINLTLLIAGKRCDGFHNIETIMAKITFYDEILVETGDRPGIELICMGSHWAPAGDDNLVPRAAKALLASTGQSADLKITLTKNIPAGSGLGSASSDAAATLLAVDKYLQLNASISLLHAIGADLGSDVPFFLEGPLAMCTGRGEKISGLSKKFDFRAAVFLPDVSVSTKKVYENYTHDENLYKSLSRTIANHILENNVDFAAAMCANMLGKSCFGLVPELGNLKNELLLRGVRPISLSGSGSAMFCLLESTDEITAESLTNNAPRQMPCNYIVVGNNRW